MKNRKRNRLPEYDYTEDGWYYVTICTHNHMDHFGEVTNGKMILNELGMIVRNSWLWLSDHYKYVELDEFIIMPNHFHGIIIIDSSKLHVGTARELSLQRATKIKSLSELIGAFKTKSSKEIHLSGKSFFKWQRSFYDRIIRTENELYYIRKYIQENPLRWDIDNNIDNLEM